MYLVVPFKRSENMTKISRSDTFAKMAEQFSRALGEWHRFLPLGMAMGVPQLLRGENHVDYRYEYYREDNNRMRIETHSVYFEQKLIDAVTAKGELIYDGISGATPRGTPSGTDVQQVNDIRRAWNISLDCGLWNQVITPGFAYSKEDDYESRGFSLSDAISFNEKNTTVQFGVSRNADLVRDDSLVNWRDKTTTEGFVGLTQLLTPKTILSANFTYGTEYGYLTDPYRVARFDLFGFTFNEQRPGHKTKEVALVSITQYFEKVNASLEASYRYHHDTYGIDSQTASLIWHQWLGKHLMVEPMFRYYTQSSAKFYGTSFPGLTPGGGFFSSDYRLSEFYSLDYGLQATVFVTEWLQFNAGYHRYEMNGLDGKTDPAMYPQANVFTVGLSLRW